MIKQINGNILNASENVIAHQVNCQMVMGGGLAKQIRIKYPSVFTCYVEHIKSKGNQNVLGDCAMVLVSKEKYIANLFGQFDFGVGKVQTDYNALKNSLTALKEYCQEFNLSVAIPYKLGCGLAGGNWDIVYKIIEEVFNDYDITIYKFE